MAKAIGMRLSKGVSHPADSKFFGDPTIPGAWANDFDGDTIFLAQIRLDEVAAFDSDGVLPHTGYFYVFLDTCEGEYDLIPIVRYFDGEPDTIVEGFNASVDAFERYTEPIGISFFESEVDADGCKLLGVPADWNYEEEAPHLLMQVDHMDETLDFLPQLDGFTYLFFGEDVTGFADVQICQEYS